VPLFCNFRGAGSLAADIVNVNWMLEKTEMSLA